MSEAADPAVADVDVADAMRPLQGLQVRVVVRLGSQNKIAGWASGGTHWSRMGLGAGRGWGRGTEHQGAGSGAGGSGLFDSPSSRRVVVRLRYGTQTMQSGSVR